MSWSDKWHSKETQDSDEGASFTNDNGILCLTGDEAEEYLFMERQPPEMELRR